ncbi:MAG: hypothetical protein KDA87_00620 [Planctomycetales bacterium]|nr:hypothetical protein [Planctomycetales bacterium]
MTNEMLGRMTPQRRQIIEHVARNEMSTNAVVQSLFFAGRHPSTTTRCTADLVAQQWLNSYTLLHPQSYLRLGRRGARAFGRSSHATEPLGPQALPKQMAVLRYVTSASGTVVRLLPTELQARYDWMPPVFQATPHCLRRSTDGDVLELIRVDFGGTADYQVRACRKFVAARLQIPGYRQLLRERSLQMVMVTTTKERAKRIQASLDRSSWPAELSFRLAVFTDLLSLFPKPR